MYVFSYLSVILAIFTAMFYHEDNVTGFCTCLFSLCICEAFSCIYFSDLNERVKNLEKQKLKEVEYK